MAFVSLLIATILFFFAAGTAEWGWDVSDIQYTLWGFFFFALGHVLPGAVVAYRTRSIPRD